MRIDIQPNERGFDTGKFTDVYELECSIQKSSSAAEDRIWLGVHDNRMHLSREHVEALLPLLQAFVDTGELNPVKIDHVLVKDLKKNEWNIH